MRPEAKKRHTDATDMAIGIDPNEPKRRNRGLSRRLKAKLAVMTGNIPKAEKLLKKKIEKHELLNMLNGLTSKDLERSGSSLLAQERRITLKSGHRSLKSKINRFRDHPRRRNRKKKPTKSFKLFGQIVQRADGRPVLHEGQSYRLPHPSRVRGYLPHGTQASPCHLPEIDGLTS